MSPKSGKDYINRINALKTNVWVDGDPVTGNISQHSAFKGIMKSQAALYDLQHQVDLKNVLTYLSPTTGQYVACRIYNQKRLMI